MKMLDFLTMSSHTSRPTMRSNTSVWVVVALLSLLSIPASAADLEPVILTTEGALASLSNAPSSSSGLVLTTDGETIDVPGSSSGASTPLGLLNSQTGELHVFWLSAGATGSQLWMNTLGPSGWHGASSLLAGGEPVTFDSAPALVVDEDRLAVDLGDEVVHLERQIVHVTWNDDDAGLRYSAFVLRNGQYVGWNEIVTVSSAYRHVHAGTEPGEIADHLTDLAVVSRSPKGGLLLTLADKETGRIGTLGIGAVPMASEILADSIHDHLLDSADLFDPSSLGSLADEMRAQIVIAGSALDFDDSMNDFFSERIESWIQENGSNFGWDLLALADATRAESLDLSQSVYRSTLQSADGADIPVFDLVDFLDSNGHRDEFSRLMRLSVVSDLAAPESVGDDVEVHVSSDGSALALSWVDTESGTVHWTEGCHGAWSESKSLATSESTDEAAIRQLISESIR